MCGSIKAIEEQTAHAHTGIFPDRQALGESGQEENVHALGKGAQAKLEEAQEQVEKERKEKEDAQAEIERLKALLAERKEQTLPQPSLARSRVTLFSAANAPLIAATKNPVLTEYNYAP